MTANYLFFLNVEYAFSILRPLQAAIRRRKGRAAWFLHGVSPSHLNDSEVRLKTAAAVRAFEPTAVFVPGNWVPPFFPGVKVEIFHGFGIEKKGHFDIRGFFDLYCTHGPLTTAPFQDLARRHGYFHVIETGWPKVDVLFQHQTPPQNTSRPPGRKPMILYAPTFSPSLTSAPALRQAIETLSHSGRFHWMIKFHPLMDPRLVDAYRSLANPHLTIIDDHDIVPWLHAADVLLTDTSSVVAEFLLLDKPAVTFRTRAPAGHLIDIQRVDDLPEALEKALARPAELMAAARRFTDRMHPYRDGRSSERVLDAVDEFIRSHQGRLRRKPLNLWRKWQVRRRLGYFSRS